MASVPGSTFRTPRAVFCTQLTLPLERGDLNGRIQSAGFKEQKILIAIRTLFGINIAFS
jgi:hypothetical protein